MTYSRSRTRSQPRSLQPSRRLCIRSRSSACSGNREKALRPTSSTCALCNASAPAARASQRARAGREGKWEAIRLLEGAIKIDPAYGAAYGLAARCYHLQTVFGWAVPADPAMQDGFRLARLAADIGKDNSEALWMAGHTL